MPSWFEFMQALATDSEVIETFETALTHLVVTSVNVASYSVTIILVHLNSLLSS